MDAEQPATLTLRDAGRILGVGPEQVRRLIASGQLRSLRQPGSRGPHLVTARDVQQLSEVRGPRDRTVHHLQPGLSQISKPDSTEPFAAASPSTRRRFAS